MGRDGEGGEMVGGVVRDWGEGKDGRDLFAFARHEQSTTQGGLGMRGHFLRQGACNHLSSRRLGKVGILPHRRPASIQTAKRLSESQPPDRRMCTHTLGRERKIPNAHENGWTKRLRRQAVSHLLAHGDGLALVPCRCGTIQCKYSLGLSTREIDVCCFRFESRIRLAPQDSARWIQHGKEEGAPCREAD